MEKLETKLKTGEFYCIKNNKNQLLDLEALNKKQCYTKCVCEGEDINCKFLDYRTKDKEVNK